MSTLLIVDRQPLIQIGLELIGYIIDLLSEGHAVELVEQRLVERSHMPLVCGLFTLVRVWSIFSTARYCGKACNVQLGPGAANDGKILAPVKLECFAWPKDQAHEGASPGSPLNLLALLLPDAGGGGHPIIRAVVAKADEVTIQLLDCSTLFAWPVVLASQLCR